MTDILPVSGCGGSDGFAGVGGAFAGALLGSWFGNGFNGNGCGGWGGGYPRTVVIDNNSCCNNGFGAGFATSILNDGVNAIQNSINGMNMNLSSGLCNIGYQTLDQSSRNQLAMMQGFSSLGHDNCQNTSNIVSAINNLGYAQQECCCKTQSTIREEGSLTRGLMQQNLITHLQTQLCDAKDKISSLKGQLYQTNLSNQQTGAILQAIREITPTTTATATA